MIKVTSQIYVCVFYVLFFSRVSRGWVFFFFFFQIEMGNLRNLCIWGNELYYESKRMKDLKGRKEKEKFKFLYHPCCTNN